MKGSWNIPADKDLTMEEIVKQGGYYDIEGLWNNITEINGKIYRGRVETFVIDDYGKIFMQLVGKDKYRIPGGSFDRDVDHIHQAYAEVLEEARLICDNITYTGVSYIKDFDKKYDIEGISWVGTYNEVYVAHYVSEYDGYIHPKNRDKTMYCYGKWYNYNKVKDILSQYHRKALDFIFNSEPIPDNNISIHANREERDTVELIEKLHNITEDFNKKNNDIIIINNPVQHESVVESNTGFHPMFTPEELHELGVMNEGHNYYCENVPIDKFTQDWFEKYEREPNKAVSSDWYNQLRDLYVKYISNPSDTLKQQILNLGWNPEVPVNYDNITKAAKLADKRNEPHEVVEIDENFIFSKKDNVYNFDKWDSGESNILIITGLSGSGKSTMAFSLAEEYDAIVIQLDHLQCYERFTTHNKNTTATGLIKKFFKSHKDLKDEDFSNITFTTFKPVFDEFFPWLLRELKKDKKNRYIIEGIHIILFTKYSDIKKYPLICINTPMYKSIIRHWIRDQFSITELVKYGIQDIKLFKTWEDSYQDFYNSMNEDAKEYLESTYLLEEMFDKEAKKDINKIPKKEIRKGKSLNSTVFMLILRGLFEDRYDDPYKWVREVKLPTLVKKCKTLDEISYLRTDLYVAKKQFETLKRNIQAIKSNDEKRIKRLGKSFVKKVQSGKIKESDIIRHERWLNTEYKKMLDQRAKEIKSKSIKESSSIDINRNIMIFDLGSVLIDGDFKQSLLNDVRIPNEYVDELIKYWIIKEDSSFTETCTKKEYMNKVYENTPKQYHRYIQTVAEISINYLKPLDWTYSLINNLREKGYDIYYLSNWNKWSVNEIIRTTETMDFLKDLDGGVFSYETGYMKPDKRIYEFFIKKYNIDPNKAIFFDDKKENIEAAEKFGIKGVLFSKDKGSEILADFIQGEEL